MQLDERSLALLDRRCARIATLGAQLEWYAELPRLLRWVLGIPMLNAYVKQILVMHENDERELGQVIEHGIQTFPMLAAEVRAALSAEANSDDGCPEELQWARFDRLVSSLTPETDVVERRACAEGMRQVLESRTNDAVRDALKANTFASFKDLSDRVSRATVAQKFAVEEWHDIKRASPRSALLHLLDMCRALNPPPDESEHWTDFVPRDSFRPYIHSTQLKENYAQWHSAAARSLARFVEELHSLAGSTLSRRLLVERFKERCVWYDKPRLREIAAVGDGTREDRLTLELAKYLHDNGLFVLVRPPISNLVPDVVGLQGLVVEAKAYEDSSHARGDIIQGFSQLHGYMTALETGALRATEGFVVAFRLGGPIYEIETPIDTGRFLIHSLTIDLGDGDVSGRKQHKTRKIETSEIFTAFASAPTPTA